MCLLSIINRVYALLFGSELDRLEIHFVFLDLA
jgi:hypothetical protein